MGGETFTPIGENIFIQPLEEAEQRTAGGLIIAREAETVAYRRGAVVAMGSEVKDKQLDGRNVLYNHVAGCDVVLAGVTYRLVKEKDVLGYF